MLKRGAVFKNGVAASALIDTGEGRLRGIFVNNAAAVPTIKLWDSLTAVAPVLVNTFTPASSTYYYFGDVKYTTGLYITISGTVDCTIFYL